MKIAAWFRTQWWRLSGGGGRRSLPPIDFKPSSTLGYLNQEYPPDICPARQTDVDKPPGDG